jgi:signal transduction histidine kinase
LWRKITGLREEQPIVRAPSFRARLFIILSLFALIPAAAVTLVWSGALGKALPLMGAGPAWERVAQSGERAIESARSANLTDEQRAAFDAHEQELSKSLEQSRRFRLLTSRTTKPVAFGAILLLIAFAAGASRVAGHLSRQLSRPVSELIGWTEAIARGHPLPEGTLRKGAPEFETLRRRMRKMAIEIEQGRARALEAERLRAFRETARQVAHELKNPLTPMRFAIENLRRRAPEELAETIEVLRAETERLERMAKSFAQFGKLPEGPAADVDLGDLAKQTARTAVPAHVALQVQVEDGLPMIRGHYDALSRALSNVLLNAVDACRENGTITVLVERTPGAAATAVDIVVRDTGCGIPADQLSRIWEPYVTQKPGGTGLGLAIARQTIVAHHGEVGATSTPGEGTEIRFTLPLPPSAHRHSVEVPTAKPEVARV